MLYHSFKGVPPVWYAAIPIYESKFDTSGEERLNYFIININKYLWGCNCLRCACHKLLCTERILYESSATTADLPGTTASVVQTSARREDDWNVTNVADDSHGIDSSSWHVILAVRCRALTKWMWASKARSVATQHSLGTQGSLHGIG